MKHLGGSLSVRAGVGGGRRACALMLALFVVGSACFGQGTGRRARRRAPRAGRAAGARGPVQRTTPPRPRTVTGSRFRGGQPLPCPYCDLKGLDLSNLNLANVNLAGADLSNADPTGANLNGAVLTGANLSGATAASRT